MAFPEYIFEPKAVEYTSAYYKFLIFIFASLYGVLLASFPMEGVTDRSNYLVYAGSSLVISARYLSSGLLSFFSNEPLWLGINILLSQYFTPEQTVRIVAGFPAFIVAYHVLRYNPRYFIFLLFLLLLPAVMKNHVGHMRQGVAISIFIMGWFATKNSLRFFLIVLTPFIHASFFFILFLFGVNWIITKIKFAIDVKVLVYIIVGLVIGVLIGFLASSLGARQGDSDLGVAEVSGLGFLFWTSILALYFIEGKDFCRKNSFTISILIFYLNTYFLFGATARVFESGLLLVVLSGLCLKQWRKQVFYMVFGAYFLIQYSNRMMQPNLGWIN